MTCGRNDYYPGGMIMPGRKFSASAYRFGFNGMESSPELKGEGNSYTAEYWEYDPRLVRRWNVDPVIKPWQSNYSTFSNNPIWKIDPKGDDDFFNADGTFSHRTKTGNNIKVITKDGAKLLAEVPLNSALNRKVVANVIGYYVNQLGIKYYNPKTGQNKEEGIIGLAEHSKKESEDVPAFTSGKDIFINKRGNKINSRLSNYYNLKSVLVHEKGHKDDNSKNIESDLFTHINVYQEQFKDENFRKGSNEFQLGLIGSFGNYLLNYYEGEGSHDFNELLKYAAAFKKNNKAGYEIFFDVSSGNVESDFKGTIYRNKKLVGTFTYRKIDEKGSD